MHGLKSAIFQKWLGWPCPQKCIKAFEKFFLFWVPMNIWKAKLESGHSFMLKYSKITVCFKILFRALMHPKK